MGDFRFNLEVSLTGRDGETRKLDWWLNWTPDMPRRVHSAIVDLAEQSGLEADWWEPELPDETR